jgi:hypothetical protein
MKMVRSSEIRRFFSKHQKSFASIEDMIASKRREFTVITVITVIRAPKTSKLLKPSGTA